MKIFHVIERLFKYGGANVACVDIATREMLFGNDVAIFSTSSSHDDNLVIPSQITTFICKRINSFFRLSYVENLNAEMKKAIDEFHPDIIHVHALWDPLIHAAIKYASMKNIPIVHSPHGMLTPWALSNKKNKKRIAWRLYQHVDLKKVSLFHVTCEDEKQDLLRLGFKQPVEVNPLGMDIPSVDLKNKDDLKLILFMSRIHPKKGLLNLVEAWNRIRNPQWQIIICGPDDDSHQKVVEDRIKTLKLNSFFEFKGSVTGKAKEDLLNKCSLFVLPTFSENFGIVVLEALAHGMPVITTVGSPWHSIEKYGAGWWIEIGVEPLYKALDEFIKMDFQERLKMAYNAQTLAKDKYSWDTIILNMLDVYKKVISKYHE